MRRRWDFQMVTGGSAPGRSIARASDSPRTLSSDGQGKAKRGPWFFEFDHTACLQQHAERQQREAPALRLLPRQVRAIEWNELTGDFLLSTSGVNGEFDFRPMEGAATDDRIDAASELAALWFPNAPRAVEPEDDSIAATRRAMLALALMFPTVLALVALAVPVLGPASASGTDAVVFGVIGAGILLAVAGAWFGTKPADRRMREKVLDGAARIRVENPNRHG